MSHPKNNWPVDTAIGLMTLLGLAIAGSTICVGLAFLAMSQTRQASSPSIPPIKQNKDVIQYALPKMNEPFPQTPAGEQRPLSPPNLPTTLSLTPSTAAAGEIVTIEGQGWPPGQTVMIYWIPLQPPGYLISSVPIEANGHFTSLMMIPHEVGQYAVTILAQLEDESLPTYARLDIKEKEE